MIPKNRCRLALLVWVVPVMLLAGENPDPEQLRTAMEEGRYAEVVAGARELLSEMTRIHGKDSPEVSEALEILVKALHKDGKDAEPETLELAERGVDLAETLYGDEDLRTALSLNNLGLVWFGRGDFPRAISFHERALEIREKILGPDDPEVAAAWNNIGNALAVQEDFQAAREVLERAVSILETSAGPDDIELAGTLNNLANVMESLEDLPAAKSIHERVIGILGRTVGPDHPQYAKSMANLGAVLLNLEEFGEAIRVLERSRELKEASLGPNHPSVAITLVSLGIAYLETGDYSRAFQVQEHAVTIMEKALGPEHTQVGVTLINFGNNLYLAGDYQGAIERQERALRIFRQNLGPEHRYVGICLHMIALSLKELGDYPGARSRMEESLAIMRKALGPDDPYVASSLVILANLLMDLGDLPTAYRMYERILAIREKAYGPDHQEVARALIGLAQYHHLTKQLDAARERYERALETMIKTVGADHPDVALIHQNLAMLQLDFRDYDEAERHIRRALEIIESASITHHPQGIGIRETFAEVLWYRKDLDGARKVLVQVLKDQEEMLGPDHPLVAQGRIDLARLDWAAGKGESAFRSALGAERILRNHFQRTARGLAEREALGFEGIRDTGLDLALSVVAGTPEKDLPAGAVEKVWEEVIHSRAMVLDEMAARHRISMASRDPDVASLVRELQAARNRLAGMVIGGPDPGRPEGYRELLSKTRSEKEGLERRLAEKSREFREALEGRDFDFQAIRIAMPENATLVAFVEFERLPSIASGSDTPPDPTESTSSYLALVLDPREGTVRTVDLGPAGPLERLILEWRKQAGNAPAGLAVAGIRAEKEYRALGNRIRKTIWDPLMRGIGKPGTVFVVPDGVFNLVSLATLPDKRGGYLVEGDLRIHYLSAERDLIRRAAPAPLGHGLLAIGGPDFDASREAIVSGDTGRSPGSSTGGEIAGAPPAGFYRSPPPSCEEFEDFRFDPLPASAAEVAEIESLWGSVSNPAGTESGESLLLTGAAASEAAFKRLASGRRVLHLATHGFFLGDRCESRLEAVREQAREELSAAPSGPPLAGDNPLVLSGLALAGANRRGEIVADSGEEDGILTAEEIASLDLSGVRWTVLSACETGIGEVRAGEGVLGLRRAFQVAGADTLIMSLWRVQDESAREWMRYLYQGRRDGLSSVEAVTEASRKMIENLRSGKKSTHPFYWGGFIAAGDWR